MANYESVQKVLNQPEMTPQKTKAYLKNIIKKAEVQQKKIGGFKSGVTKRFKNGTITEMEKDLENMNYDLRKNTLDDYMKYYQKKLESIDSKKNR